MRSILILGFILLTVTSIAQNRSVFGKVIDSTGNPIFGIIVSLDNIKSNISYQFMRVNRMGEFNFLLDSTWSANVVISIKSSFYKSISINVDSNISNYIIKLYPKVKELAPVEVKTSKPLIRRTGDTLRYNLNAFANNNDRVIADVLTKIPGVEVGTNGIIKYNGMPISNFFIDGDNILDKRYNIATNNISKDIVDEIQILENNQPIKVLQGVIIPNNAAMNITFKKGFKGKVISNLNTTLGLPNLAELDYNQIVLKKKVKGINYAKYNNIGTDYLTEHAKHDLNELSKQAQVNWDEKLFSLNTIPPPSIQKFRYNLNSNFTNSVNLLFKAKNDFIIKSNSFILFDKNSMDYKSNTGIYLPNINLSFKENQNSISHPNIYYQEVILNKNTAKYYLNNQLLGEYNYTSYSATLQSTAESHQELKEKNYKLKNELSFIKKIKKGLIDFNSLIEWNNNPQILSISKGILKNLLNDSINYDLTQQNANNKILFIKNQISYGNQFKKIKYNLKFGSILINRKNNTSIQLLNSNIFYNPINLPYANKIQSKYTNIFSILGWGFDNGRQKIDVSITPALFSLNIHTDSFTKKYSDNFTVNSSINMIQQVGRESNIRLLYSYKNEPAEVGSIFVNSYLQNYRTFFYNELPYLPERKNNIYLNYNFQRSLKLLFVNLTVSKTFANLDYIFTNEIKSNYNLTSYNLISNNQKILNTDINISKYFFKLKSTFNFKANLLNREFSILQNGIIINYINKFKQFSLNFRPTITDFLHFNTEFTLAQFYNIPKSYNQTIPKILRLGNISSFDILLNNKISFKIKGELLNYNNSNSKNSNSNTFIDFFAKYTTKKKFISYELKAYNILNKKSYLLQQSDINFVQQSEYILRPLTVLLSANIKL